ncbi:MAG: single-stranded DNA-binding protein [Clostridia bacterium]|nr:single-stranded DNA-binding protein [Clostridia bacterium]
MASFNKVILIGNLTADPELKQTPSGTSVCRFTLAVNRRYSRQDQGQNVDFIDIVAWRQNAETVAKYFKKGHPYLVCGQLQIRSWTDAQGNKRYTTEVIADEVSFVENKASATGNTDNGDTGYAPSAYGTPSYQSGSTPEFEEVQSGDDNLPF